MRPSHSHLLQYPGLRPAAAAQSAPSGIATGNPSLDAQLHWRGWPTAALTELLAVPGTGEFRLVTPTLSQLAARGWIFLLDPPYLPHAQALRQVGLPTARLLVLHCSSGGDQLWAGEQILRSGTCAAALFWEQDANWRHGQLLRLQSAARTATGPVFLYRHPQALRTWSPAPLRIGLQSHAAGNRLIIHKQPGPSGQTLPLTSASATALIHTEPKSPLAAYSLTHPREANREATSPSRPQAPH